jgi:hypothetical protein
MIVEKGILKVWYDKENDTVTLGVSEDIKKVISEEDLEELTAITDITMKVLKKYL